MFPRITPLALFAVVAVCTTTDVYAQQQNATRNKPPAVKHEKDQPLTPAKKRVVDAFIDSLELAQNWPRYVEEAQQTFADDVRSGIVSGAQLDNLPADKRAKVDAVIDEMIPHIVEDMKAELLKVDATALYHDIGYDVYGRHFTTHELKDLTAIYNSPLYHRAMPAVIELRKTKPEASDDELRTAIGKDDFDALAKLLSKPAYAKLMQMAPMAQEATGEYIGALVGGVSERVGRNYSPVLLEKLKEIMNENPENQQNAPTSVQAGFPASPAAPASAAAKATQ
ncbi:MAG TPA: hypothetical protein VF472_04490 [Burkholderiaceae bacterium]